MKFYYDVKRRMPSKQILMRINLTCLFLCFSLLQVSASGFAQKISLTKKNITLQQLFQAIKVQTGYDVIYEPQELKKAKPVTLNVTNEALRNVLDQVFSEQPLTYAIDQQTIVIRRKEKTFFESMVDFKYALNVKGKVVDEKNQPLAGATIRIKNGSDKAILTNEKGEFLITNADRGTVLVISFLGYKTKEVTINDENDLLISLEVNSAQLESVSVMSTGYQSLSKERATGSFNIISREQLDKPTTNIAQRLIGTTAGMQARLDVNGNPRFEIRGQTSLNTAAASPLVVVDGFAIQGDFSTINPNDVESVTILKDAAAASIWGAKSANGVIVVVTKKSQKGVPLKVDFSAFTTVSKKLDLDYVNPLASSAETVDYEMKAFNNWSARVNTGALTTNVGYSWSLATMALSEYALGFMTAAQRDALLARYRTQSNKDQIRNELLTHPTVQQYNLRLSGSSGRLSNNLSLMAEDTKSNFKGTTNTEYIANYRAGADVFNWLEVSFSGLMHYNKARNNGVGLGDIQNMSPYEMLRNEDGSLTNIHQYYTPILDRFVPMNLFPYADWTYNPIQEIANRNNSTEQINSRLHASLKFKLLKGLSFTSSAQYELFNSSTRNIANENTFQVRNAINTAATWDQATNKITLNLPKGGTLSQSRVRTESYVIRNQVNFDRRFGEDHDISFVSAVEVNNLVRQTFGNPITYGFNETTLSVGTFPNGPGGTFYPIKNWLGNNQTFGISNSYGYTTDRYFSLLANASYTFKNKYIVSGSVRSDASNLITDDPAYRYAPFWSAGIGWHLSKEPFMRNIKWIDRLNLRATYGYNGNVDKSTAFMPLIAMGSIPNIYTGDITGTVSSYGNPTLRWEKTGSLNLALDYSLFKGQLYGRAEVYRKSGKDLIAALSIPAINGTTSQRLNNAEMTNHGGELELGTAQRIKGNAIVWRGSFNISFNKNKITKLFVANYAASTLVGGGSAAYVEGENANTIWRFRYAGIKNTQPMVYGADGTLYDFGAFTPGDGRTYLKNMGTTVAPYTLGFINSFQIYDFNVSAIITGQFGHVFQRTGFNYPPTWTTRVLPNKKLSEVVNGDPMKIVPLPLNLIEPRYYFWDRFHQNLDYLIENASHIRMQEVNVSYNLPASLLNKLNIKRVQLFVQGNDLFTVVANNAGEDPEYPLGGLKPQPRISLGFKCEF